MKKFIAIVAVAISLTACTGGNTETTDVTTDSTKVDTTGGVAVDSNGLPAIDTTVVATDSTE